MRCAFRDDWPKRISTPVPTRWRCRSAKLFLSKEPNAPDILAMLGEIETRLQASGEAIAKSATMARVKPKGLDRHSAAQTSAN